jgi:hypothetical protein
MDLVPDGAAEERVDARGGLVQDQQVRLVDEGRRELEATLHAPRQGTRPAASDRPQVDQREHRLLSSPAPEQDEPEQGRGEVDVLADREVRVQAEQLGHVADPLARPPPERVRLLPEHLDPALRGSQRAGDHADRRGLARPRRPDQPNDRPGRDLEIQVLDGLGPVEPSSDACHANGDRGFDDWVLPSHWLRQRAGSTSPVARHSVSARRLQG